MGLVGTEVVGVCGKAPSPVNEGRDLSLLGFFGEGKFVIVPQLYVGRSCACVG